ncbi:hypothetical protein RFI_18770 [Reticulomyxa filosa]|uniref:DNA2/NAM7 helicase helicase domain-containing protein n=1 Tax=Reticulomyxa filosa TaxID=46433 RepID=X6MXF5_RETFI|nr:hypothetical protein RFI_18770 [Reticulomyxa filosa]|eukprot:ETO18494.1 hypothetical protein RFI_18770 [Reticulomyxa filosa]
MSNPQNLDELRKIVRDGLEKTRRDLLDLSGRNRLLNFKHTSAKIIRFVDELPNHIYTELLSSADSDSKGGFILSPVQLPKKSDYPDIEDKKNLLKIDVKTHAKNLAISTEWEMQAITKSSKPYHHDDKLQTLLYPEDLDRLARRIQSEARTAVEESGVNMLFLCLGFLKWSDSNNSDIFNQAPLIMIPVEIERQKVDSKTGYAKFHLKYTGEDILDNICLREKLLQFAIELPSFEGFESPEEYFSALEKILTDIKPDWAIQRFITLGFLSFGKMLMYLDLDPARWPEVSGIADTPLIVDIFRGNHSGDGNVAADFDIDNDKTLPKLPHVMDADSSQHSAIIDVLRGKNIVVEGPPGTGKSQTITNLIAACLAEGKTVLFVTEKLAALEVVRKRLDSVNLGNFCLELHSHKTQKKTMMNDLKKRLDMNTNSYKAAANLADMCLSELNQKKQKLIQYTEAINAPYGKTEETPHQIFWKTEALYKELSQPYKAESYTAPKNVAETTIAELRGHIELIRNLADNFRDYFGGENKTKTHYWFGLNIQGPADWALQQDIFTGLQKLAGTASEARTAYAHIESKGFQDYSFGDFPSLASGLAEFSLEDFNKANLYELLKLDEIEPLLKHTIILVETYKNHLESYSEAMDACKIQQEQLNKFSRSVSIDDVRLPEALTFQEMYGITRKAIHAIADFKKTIALFKEAAGYLNLGEEINSIKALRAITHGAGICSAIDKTILSYRNPVIENAIGNPALPEITTKVKELCDEQAALKEHFELDKVLPIERLKEIQQAFKNKGILSILSSQWRLALLDYRKFAKNKKEKDYSAVAVRIESLINYCAGVEALAQNAVYKTLLPNFYCGIETDIESLKSAVSFYDALRNDTLKFPTYGTRLYNVLKYQDRLIYDWFSEQKAELEKGLNALDTIKSVLVVKAENTENLSDTQNALKSAKAFVEEYSRVRAFADEADIPADLTLKQLKEAFRLTSVYEAIKKGESLPKDRYDFCLK